MGGGHRNERSCKCGKAWTEYDDHVTCIKCRESFFEGCGCIDALKSYAGVGFVCEECDNYNHAPVATNEDLLEFALTKYGITKEELEAEWDKEQPTVPLKCFRCQSKTCTHCQSHEIELTEKECNANGLDNETEHYGICCQCVIKYEGEDQLTEVCDACKQSSGKKLKV